MSTRASFQYDNNCGVFIQWTVLNLLEVYSFGIMNITNYGSKIN